MSLNSQCDIAWTLTFFENLQTESLSSAFLVVKELVCLLISITKESKVIVTFCLGENVFFMLKDRITNIDSSCP